MKSKHGKLLADYRALDARFWALDRLTDGERLALGGGIAELFPILERFGKHDAVEALRALQTLEQSLREEFARLRTQRDALGEAINRAAFPDVREQVSQGGLTIRIEERGLVEGREEEETLVCYWRGPVLNAGGVPSTKRIRNIHAELPEDFA